MNRRIWLYLGIFCISTASLMFELLLLRIFSVMLFYHFAFMAVAIALFGLTAGAVAVYLFQDYFYFNQPDRRVYSLLSKNSLLFGISSILVFLIAQFVAGAIFQSNSVGLFRMTLLYSLIAIPFVFSGICLSLAMSRFSAEISKLYSADLLGASAGCILLILVLNLITAPTAIISVAFIASLGSFFFSIANRNEIIFTQSKGMNLSKIALVIALMFFGLTIANTILDYNQKPIIKLFWVRGKPEQGIIYEKWNSYSRLTVIGDTTLNVPSFGWALSPIYPKEKNKYPQLWLYIDSFAGTPLIYYSGDSVQLEHLKYDLVNLAHYLRENAKVAVIGSGGGRDILSALAFNQKSVIGIEINNEILKIVNKKFGWFTGHLDRLENVKFVNADAYLYLLSTKDEFDIIQSSMTDTFAATLSGAFTLTENSLYTVEAWTAFLTRLSKNGILTFSRHYLLADTPYEIYRLVTLAIESLSKIGIQSPADHIIVVRQKKKPTAFGAIGTILVSKSPFSKTDLAKLESLIQQLQFELVYSPTYSQDTIISQLVRLKAGTALDRYIRDLPLDISAPTLDRPFFFNLCTSYELINILRLFLKSAPEIEIEPGFENPKTLYQKGVLIVGSLLIITASLTLLFILVPIFSSFKLADRKEHLQLADRNHIKAKGAILLISYFVCIGLGFMLIEISQTQRFTLFLGHPVYSLSVVLFSLLLSSGLGAYLTKKIMFVSEKDARENPKPLIYLFILLVLLFLFGKLTNPILNTFRTASIYLRILLVLLSLFSIGLFMGTALPIGMKFVQIKAKELTPILFGINGASSVFGSVVSVAISLSAGISAAYLTGLICYTIAFIWLAIVRKI